MLFADMNNLLYRYYHTNKDKTFKDILNIVENYLIKVMEKKKIDEGFLFFDPIKIKDKTWRYEFKPNYKDNKLQETLFDIKKDFFIENNNDFSNNINELKFNILNNRFLEVQFLFEKWNIPLDENKLKKLEPLDLIKSYEKLIENNNFCLNCLFQTSMESKGLDSSSRTQTILLFRKKHTVPVWH